MSIGYQISVHPEKEVYPRRSKRRVLINQKRAIKNDIVGLYLKQRCDAYNLDFEQELDILVNYLNMVRRHIIEKNFYDMINRDN
jgi:hypothetical protein